MRYQGYSEAEGAIFKARSALGPQFSRQPSAAGSQGKNGGSVVTLFGMEDRILDSESVEQLKNLHRAIRIREPEELISALLACSEDYKLLIFLPATTFLEIFRILDPEHYISRYKNVHYELKRSWVEQRGLREIKSVFRSFMDIINLVSTLRTQAGFRLGLATHKTLLQCAAVLGDGRMADRLWENMKLNRVEPDVSCYNHYLTAKCWAALFRPTRRFRVRITPYYLYKRTQDLAENKPFTIGPQTSRSEIVRMYNLLVHQGLKPDVATYGLLLIGMARDGDVQGMTWVLKNVWNVDVDQLVNDPESAPEPVELSRFSPLYPDGNFLFTLAHTFGINNDVGTALKLVDFFSQQYEIQIPRFVWEELFERTFVLASRQTNKWDKVEKLPYKALHDLWDTMTSEPYNISPTMSMYNRMIRNTVQRGMPWKAALLVEQGWRLYLQSVRTAKMKRRMVGLCEELEAGGVTVSTPGLSMARLRKDAEYAKLVKTSNDLFIMRWTRLLLVVTKFVNHKKGNQWETRDIPDLIAHLRIFLPRVVRYQFSGGTVEFDCRPPSFGDIPNWSEFRPHKIFRYITGPPRDYGRSA